MVDDPHVQQKGVSEVDGIFHIFVFQADANEIFRLIFLLGVSGELLQWA